MIVHTTTEELLTTTLLENYYPTSFFRATLNQVRLDNFRQYFSRIIQFQDVSSKFKGLSDARIVVVHSYVIRGGCRNCYFDIIAMCKTDYGRGRGLKLSDKL